MCADGVPVGLAHQLANTRVLGSAPDIIEIAAEAQRPLTDAAQIYFLVGDRLNMLWLLSTIIAFPVHSKWQALARSNLREDSYRLHRRIAARILQIPGATAQARLDEIGRAHVRTPVTTAQLVCRLLLETTKTRHT